jgi:hypothetical protein
MTHRLPAIPLCHRAFELAIPSARPFPLSPETNLTTLATIVTQLCQLQAMWTEFYFLGVGFDPLLPNVGPSKAVILV